MRNGVAADIILVTLIAVIGKGMAHAARCFPLEGQDAIKHAVFRRAGVPDRWLWRNNAGEPLRALEGVRRKRAVRRDPAIIGQAVRHVIVIFGENLEGVFLGRIGDIIPEIVGLVAVDQLSVVGICILGVVFILARHGGQEVGKALDPLVFERPVHAAGLVDAEF